MSDEREHLSEDEELAAVIRENVRAVQTKWAVYLGKLS